MATNPLVPVFGIDLSSDQTGQGPVGVSGLDPLGSRVLSQEAWDQMNPDAQATWLADFMTGGDSEDDGESEDNFNDDAGLDTSQVTRGDGPPVPPRAQLPDSSWREDVEPGNGTLAPGVKISKAEANRIGRLSPLQQKQRDRALGQIKRHDDAVEALRDAEANDLPTVENIEPGWQGDSEYEDRGGIVGALQDYGKHLAEKWHDNEVEYERRLNPDADPVAPDPKPTERVGMIPTANDYAGVPVTPDPGEQVAANAVTLLRSPATDPASFVRKVWGEANMPALAEEQLLTGRAAALNEARPGDLVARVDDHGNAALLGVYLKDGEFVANGGDQLSRRRADEYADKVFAVRVGEKDTAGRSNRGVDLSPQSQQLARDINRGLDDLADSLSDLFNGGSKKKKKKKKDSDRDGGGGGQRNRKRGGLQPNHNYGGGHKGTGRTAAQTRQHEGRNSDGSRGKKKKKKSYKGKRPGPG